MLLPGAKAQLPCRLSAIQAFPQMIGQQASQLIRRNVGPVERVCQRGFSMPHLDLCSRRQRLEVVPVMGCALNKDLRVLAETRKLV
jgi:hypothetical protein